MTAFLAALSLALAGDVVHTRDGKKYEGKLIEYDFFVDVEADPPPAPAPGKPPPKPTRIHRKDILKIELAPDFIRFPEVISFPFDQLEKADYTYSPCSNLILCLPKPPQVKVIAIDLRSGKKAWDIDLPNRIADPVIGGRTVYFMQREKEVDDTKKVKINGVAGSKEIHRLTVTSIEIATGTVQWKAVFDNNDRKDQHWEYVPVFPPALYVLPDRLSIRTLKMGYPMDSQMNIDRNRSTRYVSFSSYDPVAKKVIANTDSTVEAEMGYPYFAEDLIVTQLYQGAAKWRLSGISMKDGKLRWQSDPFTTGQLFDVTEEFAYVADPKELCTFSVKNGRKTPGWTIDCSGGTIPGIDLNYIYLYRTKVPRAIVGFEPKKGTEAWKIDMPDTDTFKHLLFAGHRLLYTDKQNTIVCFDTLAKKEMWRWSGVKIGYADYAKVMGTALSFYKDGRVTQLDLDTGKKIWEVKLEYNTVLQAGDAGLMCRHLRETDIIHERKVPKGAEFPTATGTPIKYSVGIPGRDPFDYWSIPALGKDALYTVSQTGQLAAFDLKEKKLLWLETVSAKPIGTLSPPIIHAKGIAVNTGFDTVSFEPDGKTRQWSAKHLPLRPDQQCEVTPQGLLTVSENGAQMIDPATGKAVWETPLKNVNGHSVAEGKIYTFSHREVIALDLKTGGPADPLPIPRGVTHVAVEGKRMFIATGPYGLFEFSGGEARPLLKTRQQDPRIVIKGFKGSLLMADGAAFYTHADGQVVRWDSGAEKPAWTFASPGFTSPLLIHGGRLWFGAAGLGLFGLNLKTGAVEWKLDGLPDAQLFSPFLRDGKVAFWSSDGWLLPTE